MYHSRRKQHELLLGEVGIELARTESCETPGPTPRTTGTPTCRASRSRRGCRGAPSRGCGPSRASRRRRRLTGIAFEPVLHDVVVELLGPQQPRGSLPHDIARVAGDVWRDRRRRRTRPPRWRRCCERVVEARRRRRSSARRSPPECRQAQPDRRTCPAAGTSSDVVQRRFGAGCRGIHRSRRSMRRRSRERRPSRTAVGLAAPNSRA